MSDPAALWRDLAGKERGSNNPHQKGTPDHDGYNGGFDYAVLKTPRGPGHKRTPAWTKGLVQGMMWRRRNPAPQ